MRPLRLFLVAFAVFLPLAGSAEEEPDFSGDKTGTNPINFTHDLRVYNEYLWLNTKGDGDKNVMTVEYRQPLLDGAWQFRTRIRLTDVQADRVNGLCRTING